MLLTNVSRKIAGYFGLGVLLGTSVAFGHDPFSSTVTARFQHGRLEVRIIMAENVAGELLAKQGVVETDPSELPGLLPHLEELAATFVEVTAGGVAEIPERTTVVGKPGEVEINLVYPFPEKGPVRLNAAFLGGLPGAFSGTITVFDEAENMLGSKNVSGTNLAVEVAVPAIKNPPPVELAATPPAPRPGLGVRLRAWIEGMLAGRGWWVVAAVLIGGIGWGWRTVQRSGRR